MSDDLEIDDLATRAAYLAVLMAREPEFEGVPLERVAKLAVKLARAGLDESV